MSSLSSFKKGVSLKQDQKNLTQRVETLEANFTELVNQVNSIFGDLQKHNSEVDDIMKGVVSLMGADKVAESMVAARTKEIEAEAANKKAKLEKALAEGKIAVASAIGPESVIVGSEYKSDGTQTSPKENIVGVASLNDELRALLLGKVAGDTINLPVDGHTFVILQVFDVVPEVVVPETEAPPAANTL